MRIEDDVKLDYSDVLIRPKRSTLTSRAKVDLVREFSFMNSKKAYKGIPVMASNMDTTGTFEMAKELNKYGLFTCIHKHYTVRDWSEAYQNGILCEGAHIAVSVGTSREDLEKLSLIVQAFGSLINYICLDVANGYSEKFVDTVKMLRDEYSSKTIIAGNVVTGEMTEELLLSGADIIKIGIGPGAVCTTRKKTGVGYPQLSAVIECADAAHGLGGHIIADGGCVCSGDIAKAFGAGADFVMLGGMFAGHDECGGSIIYKEFLTDEIDEGGSRISNSTKLLEFYGMSSKTAQEKYSGELAEYRASEGKRVLVPYKGPVKNTIQDILGGVRSACTYVGATKLKELSKRTTFIRVSRQLNESLSMYEAGE